MVKINYLDYALMYSFYRNEEDIEVSAFKESKYKVQNNSDYPLYIDLSHESFQRSSKSSYAFLTEKNNKIHINFKKSRSKLSQYFIDENIKWKYPRNVNKYIKETITAL